VALTSAGDAIRKIKKKRKQHCAAHFVSGKSWIQTRSDQSVNSGLTAYPSGFARIRRVYGLKITADLSQLVPRGHPQSAVSIVKKPWLSIRVILGETYTRRLAYDWRQHAVMKVINNQVSNICYSLYRMHCLMH